MYQTYYFPTGTKQRIFPRKFDRSRYCQTFPRTETFFRGMKGSWLAHWYISLHTRCWFTLPRLSCRTRFECFTRCQIHLITTISFALRASVSLFFTLEYTWSRHDTQIRHSNPATGGFQNSSFLLLLLLSSQILIPSQKFCSQYSRSDNQTSQSSHMYCCLL